MKDLLPYAVIAGIAVALIALGAVANWHDARCGKRIIAFLAGYGLTYTSYNGAGYRANPVEKALRKNPGLDLTKMALADNFSAFQTSLWGGYRS